MAVYSGLRWRVRDAAIPVALIFQNRLPELAPAHQADPCRLMRVAEVSKGRSLHLSG
jgi:hypothetical protein